jgi:hypothetical protein
MYLTTSLVRHGELIERGCNETSSVSTISSGKAAPVETSIPPYNYGYSSAPGNSVQPAQSSSGTRVFPYSSMSTGRTAAPVGTSSESLPASPVSSSSGSSILVMPTYNYGSYTPRSVSYGSLTTTIHSTAMVVVAATISPSLLSNGSVVGPTGLSSPTSSTYSTSLSSTAGPVEVRATHHPLFSY